MSLQIYNQDDEQRLILASMFEAADLASQGDPNLAAAITTWREKSLGAGDDPQLRDAIHVISTTCAQFGLDRGLPGEIPAEPTTAEYGRVSACRDIFYYVPDEVLYADDQPYTVDDCLDASEAALDQAYAQDTYAEDAYELTVEAFFELTPGFACYGEDCWTAEDF
jgi:hypothetical protein